MSESDLFTNQLDWVDWSESILFFSQKLVELIQFLSQVSWLVTESIRFHKEGDWVDWIWGTAVPQRTVCLYDWINWIYWKYPKKVNEIKRFPEKVNEIEAFSEKVKIYIELID